MSRITSVDANAPWIQYGKTWKDFHWPKTIGGDDLAVPGVEIEVETRRDKASKFYLLGDLNCLGGTCDDCSEFLDEVIIKRYRQVVAFKDEEAEGNG